MADGRVGRDVVGAVVGVVGEAVTAAADGPGLGVVEPEEFALTVTPMTKMDTAVLMAARAPTDQS